MSGVCEDAGLCEGIVCDDGQQCTEDICDPAKGTCVYTPVEDDTSCNFNGFPGACASGVCEDAMLCEGVVCGPPLDAHPPGTAAPSDATRRRPPGQGGRSAMGLT